MSEKQIKPSDDPERDTYYVQFELKTLDQVLGELKVRKLELTRELRALQRGVSGKQPARKRGRKEQNV